MGKKLYIGNLSYSVDSTQLSDLFTQVGSVESANVIIDRDSGRSKGFAFVEMSDANEAQEAIGKYNGFSLEGRTMNVSEAKPSENRNSGGRGGSFRSRPGY